ncbi:hypothetical protein Trydic_g9708 [Trypoxylus dichotomus]
MKLVFLLVLLELLHQPNMNMARLTYLLLSPLLIQIVSILHDMGGRCLGDWCSEQSTIHAGEHPEFADNSLSFSVLPQQCPCYFGEWSGDLDDHGKILTWASSNQFREVHAM